MASCATSEKQTERDQTNHSSSKEEPQEKSLSSTQSDISPESNKIPPLQMGIKDRLYMALLPDQSTPSLKKEKGYSITIKDMSLENAIYMFAKAYKLNIVIAPEVLKDNVSFSLSFKDLSYAKAMEALLDSHGYYWEAKKGLITIKKFKTKIFNIDYVRLQRHTSGVIQAQLSSQVAGEGSGFSGITIQSEITIRFWESLKEQLEGLMSKDKMSSLIINRQAGIIVVTDLNKNVQGIDNYITRLSESLHRQVEIQARIFEITLNDEFSLGINWSFLDIDSTTQNYAANVTFGPSVIPFGQTTAKNPTLSLLTSDFGFDGIISALKEQGEIRIVSQPKIKTLNNQPALIKVGTDRPFFTRTTTLDRNGIKDTTYEVQYITIGVVLSIVPQISEDNMIILDVMPVVTRLVSIDSVNSDQGVPLATAPVVDVKQASTIVRVKNNGMIVIGGLIQDETTESKRKIPILGDLPLIGKLFTGTYETTSKRELVVFLTPKIIEN